MTLTLKLAKSFFFHTALGRAHDFLPLYQDRLQKVSGPEDIVRTNTPVSNDVPSNYVSLVAKGSAVQ